MRVKIRLGKVQIQLKEDEPVQYKKILQTKPTNVINRVRKNNIKEDNITGIGRVNISGVEVRIDDCKTNTISVNTNKVFDLIMLNFTEAIPYGEKTPLEVIDERREININLLDYMAKCGLKDKKEARKQLIAGLKTLYNTSLEWTEKRAVSENGKRKKVMKEINYSTRIVDSIGIETGSVIKNNVAVVKLNIDIAKYFTYTGYICPYNMNVLKLNAKNLSNPLAKTLLELNNINKDNEKRRDIISIRTVLNRTGRMETYNNLNRKSGFTRKIIETIERDFDELLEQNILEYWEYAKPDGERYTDEDMGYDENEEPTGEKKIFLSRAEDYLNQNIIFKFKNYPEAEKKK